MMKRFLVVTITFVLKARWSSGNRKQQIPAHCSISAAGAMAENDRVGSGDQARVRSCPLYSTCFTANIAVPASPKCGNSFCSRLPATKSRQQIGMPAILPALMLGVAAWVTTPRRRSPNHPIAASARSASPLGIGTPLERHGQLETQKRSPRVTHRPAAERVLARRTGQSYG